MDAQGEGIGQVVAVQDAELLVETHQALVHVELVRPSILVGAQAVFSNVLGMPIGVLAGFWIRLEDGVDQVIGEGLQLCVLRHVRR